MASTARLLPVGFGGGGGVLLINYLLALASAELNNTCATAPRSTLFSIEINLTSS